MATLASYTTLVQNEVDDTSAASKTVIEQQIRETYQEILRQAYKFFIEETDETETAVVGQDAYTTDTEILELKRVLYKQATGTKYQELRQILKNQVDLDAENSVPTMFYLDGDKIKLHPAPSDAGTIRFIYLPIPGELVSTSLIPDRFTRTVVLGACYRFFGYEKGPESENYKQWYYESLFDMLKELNNRVPVINPTLY